eukprot:6571131-Pyramimonas_sp.AAC.1
MCIRDRSHRELHGRPQWQWQGSHAVPPHITHTFRGPIGSSTEDDIRICGTHNCIQLDCSETAVIYPVIMDRRGRLVFSFFLLRQRRSVVPM